MYMQLTLLNYRLQSELGKKQAELATNLKDYKNLENRLHEQQRKEEEIHRKATFTVSKYGYKYDYMSIKWIMIIYRVSSPTPQVH